MTDRQHEIIFTVIIVCVVGYFYIKLLIEAI